MANKVVGFSIEINGQKQIEATTKLLGLLNTQAILLNNTIKDLEKSGINLSKDLKLTGDSAQKMSKVMKDSFKTFDEGNKVVTDLGNGYFEVTKAIEKEAKVIKETTKEELIALEIKRKIARENKQVAKQEAIIQTETKNNIASLRAQLSLTTLEWKKYTVEELKNTDAGRKVAAEKKRLTALLLKEEKATGDARRQVGFYEKATASLGKTLLKLSVGRDIIRGLFQGLATVVEENKDVDASAKSVSQSFERLIGAAKKVGLAVIQFVAKPLKAFIDGAESVSQSLFGIGFGTEKASEGVRDLQKEFNAEIEVLKRGNLSTEARKQLITDINTKYKEYLPNLLDENASLEDITTAQNAANKAFEKKILLLASEEQFIDLTKRRLDALRQEAALQRQLAENEAKYQESLRNGTKVSKDGINTSAAYAKQYVGDTQLRIAANRKVIDSIEQEKATLDEVIKAEGINTADFVSNQVVKTEAELKGIEDRRAARQKEADELRAAQQALLTDIQAQNIARIELIKDLSSELKQAEIANIADQTQAAIAAEKERFELSKEARKKNFEETLKEIEREELELIKLFGFSSKEFEKFEQESGLQLLQIQENNNAISEQEAIKHQETLLKITKDGEKSLLNAKQKAFEDDLAEAQAEYDELNNAREEYYEKQIRISIEAGKKLEEENKKSREAAKDTAIELINTTFSVINDLVAIANDAENQRFDDAIERRQQTISKLSEDLENATGLQKKFLQRQIAQEEEALKKETIIKEKALKKQAETQKAIAISQAVVNGALGVTGILGGQISGNPVVDAVLKAALIAALVATTATEIAVISSQKFAKGGFTGQGTTRDETGHKVAGVVHDNEYVVPKSILQTSKGSTLVSELESMRIGKIPKFATGGFTSPIMTAPVLANNQSDSNNKLDTFIDAAYSMADATNRRIDRLQVVQDLNNLNDIQQNALNLKQQTTIS